MRLFICCVLQASADMEGIFLFIDNLNKRLARGIKDLDDVRSSMAALSEIRESEIRFVLVHILCSIIVTNFVIAQSQMLPDEELFRVECFLQTPFKIALKNGAGLSNIRQRIFKKIAFAVCFIDNTLCVSVAGQNKMTGVKYPTHFMPQRSAKCRLDGLLGLTVVTFTP